MGILSPRSAFADSPGATARELPSGPGERTDREAEGEGLPGLLLTLSSIDPLEEREPAPIAFIEEFCLTPYPSGTRRAFCAGTPQTGRNIATHLEDARQHNQR